MKSKVQPIDAFERWAMPLVLIWASISGLALPLLGNYLKIPLISVIGNNLFTGSMMLYMLHAMSLAWFFMRKNNIPKALRIVLCVFLYFTPFFSGLMPYAGVLDTFYDFRKLRS
jgi:uncharacterized protein YybS (DUF2232 family)